MYCSLEDLKVIIPEETLLDLTDDNNRGEFIVTPPNEPYQVVVAAIEEADAIIDSYLVNRFELPLVDIPKIIVKISAHLSVCCLFDRKHESKLPEGLAERRKNQIKLLEAFQSGKASIQPLAKSEPAEFLSNKTNIEPTFSDSLLGMY